MKDDRRQNCIRLYNEMDQLREEGKEEPGGPHMHMTVIYKDSGKKTKAYQIGALGLGTEFVGIDYNPDGTIEGAGIVSGTEWDEQLGRMDHLLMTEAKIKKERGEKLEEWEERAISDNCTCVDCSDNVECTVDWKSHRRKLMDGDPDEIPTDEDKREQEGTDKQLGSMINTFKRYQFRYQSTRVLK